jgi:D-aspartate ligase
MQSRVLSLDELLARLRETDFARAPALVSNAHVTGLAVARALARHDVPVIALDRTADGVAVASDAVDFAATVTYPLDDPAGYRADVGAVADALDHRPVAFGCMDEWVHALAETRPDGVVLPFTADRIDAVLDKTNLYALCDRLDVPYPESYRIEATGTDSEGPPVRSASEAADALGFPLVLKPARKRAFEEVAGTNVLEVADREEYRTVVEEATDAGVRLMAQERVDVAPGEDRSLASYVPESGDPIGVVGNARARQPAGYGTSCVVDTVTDPDLRERALSVLEASGYAGISEAEFVYDRARETYVLLDVNTRPWKWIGLPVAAGANLPMAAYADAVDADVGADAVETDSQAYAPETVAETRWVSFADYLQLLADGGRDVLSESEWLAAARGDVDGSGGLTTAVYDPADPGPTYRLAQTELTSRDYYCAC